MAELQRPAWRDTNALCESLTAEPVKNALKTQIRSKWTEKDGYQGETVDDELNYAFPHLLKSVRVTDLADPRYWLWLFGLALVFVIGEACLFLAGFKGEPGDHGVRILLVAVICIVLATVAYWACLFKKRKPPETLDGQSLAPSQVHTVPLVACLVVLAISNGALLMRSGWGNSPLLPALLTLGAMIVGLPRENSRSSLAISVAVIGLCVGATLWREDVPPAWKDPCLAKWLTAATFFYSASVAIVLRQVSQRKVAEK